MTPMEQKKRRNISIPLEVDTRLKKDKHASQTIVEALERYWAGKDGAKAIAKLTQEATDAVNGLDEDVEKTYKLVRKIVIAMQNQGADISL